MVLNYERKIVKQKSTLVYSGPFQSDSQHVFARAIQPLEQQQPQQQQQQQQPFRRKQRSRRIYNTDNVKSSLRRTVTRRFSSRIVRQIDRQNVRQNVRIKVFPSEKSNLCFRTVFSKISVRPHGFERQYLREWGTNSFNSSICFGMPSKFMFF